MTTMLALETSGSLCSVAVLHEAELTEDTHNVERMHNEVVLCMVDEVCERAGVSRRDIDVVAFGAGPGSFTGVRIAAAVAQGIAFGAHALMVPVSSSMAMAQAALSQVDPLPTQVLTMTRSRRDVYYLAGFSVHAGALRTEVHDVLCSDWPIELLNSEWLAVGDRPPWWDSPSTVGQAQLEWGGEVSVTAGVIAELGLATYRSGDALEPAAGLPRYVDGDSPWVKQGKTR
jgi:tRNA threonylcarbamoyladenosine biosynthesis protein TsaB